MEQLSYIDEHTISVDASMAQTWSALLRVLRRDRADEAIPQQRLTVNGRHLCFAVYRLVFELDPDADSGGTRLRVLTWAAFPGVRGKLFRAFAIGAGAHRFVVRQMLKNIAAQARPRGASVG